MPGAESRPSDPNPLEAVSALDAMCLSRTYVDSAALDAVLGNNSRVVRSARDAVAWKYFRLIEPHIIHS